MIPAIQEINFPSYATLHQATASFAEMGERSITTQVRIDGDVVPNFDGWELSFKGERFILNTKDPQAVKDNTTRNSLVDLTFVSWPINELKRYFFFEAASVGAGTAIADKYKASVNLNVEDFAVLFNQVLNHYFDGKIVFSLYMSGQGQYSTGRALVEIDYTYIWDVLVKFFEVYGVRWRIEYNSTTDVYTIKAGWPDASIDDHDFEYGYKGGLLRFERQVQDIDIHNILLGRGGEKNLPYRYFKRVDPQNPDWAADPDAIPELANISFDRLRDINFRWYVRGWMQNPNHDTSWEQEGYVYPTYSSVPAQYQFAYDKGRTDERFNPVEYVRDLQSIEAYGEHWGALDDNDEVFPTIQGVTREPFGRIDETVAVSEIITDDISAMAQNAAVEKSINRMSVSLYGNTRTEFEILSEEFTIPEGSTGNISYAPFGTDDIYPNLVRFDTENSTVVAVSGDTEYPISAIPAGTYRLKLNMVIARSGQATSATGTYGIENIVLTTSSQDADAWKPTFDIWVKNIWNTAPQQGESDVQYAERVWLPILGDRAGNEAKIVFSSGFMSVSEDYEFTIASYPVRDTSKSINGVPSEWRITLRKSDAEFDATGLYIPNASTGGKPVAGDKFFFIGIDMPHMYVTLAEEDLNTNKSAQLDTEAAVNPTWIMNLDKVRVHTLEDDEYGQTLADRLAAGTKVWITDPRFTPGRKLQLYIQSITYTWNEPTDESPYIVPDIEVVLSDKVVATESVVQRIQNDVSSIKNQYARISDVEAVVRSVAEPIFLKKTGESDSSDSPTQFSSKVTSKGFRQGGIGGKGWGIYRDNTSDFAEGEEGEGDTVIEVDRIVARKELQVNSLVVNQIAYRGGMEVISAAEIEVSKVIETDTEYICYFDQKQNSVANSFIAGDIAMGMIFNAANTAVERYYKAIVTATDIDCIHLSKTQKVGAGAPAVGDTIIQYGNPTNTARQYVIVRDVIGGGYERMISGLNSLNTDGDEYYFAGKQSSESGPRWFVGSHAENGDYAEYINGVLTIKADVIFKAGQVIPGIADLTDDVEALGYLKTALPKSDTIISGGLILSKVIALRDSNEAIKSGINGDPTLSNIAAWYGGPMADKYATPTPQDYAKSIFRFDGSGYLAGGNIRWDDQGYGGIPGITWSNDGANDIVTIGANVRLASVDGDTVTDLLNAVNSIKDWFELIDGNIHVKNNRGFWTGGFISAGGISPGGGASAGNAILVAQTYGGTLSATGIDGINFYSKERVDQLLLTAGKVQTVAGIAPTSGDIPVASLKSALGLGAAAAYGIGSVASGNTGLVTGGSVYSAINEAVSSVMKMQGTTTTPLSDGSTTNPVVIDGESYTAKKGDVVLYDGKEYLWAGSAWEQLGDEASWALKTTSISAGTGLDGGGTLASNRTISINPTYQTYISNGNTAYGWGDWRTRVGTLETNLTALTTRVTTLEGRTNWDTYFGVDENGDIYVKKNGDTARNFYSWGAVSAGGLSDGGGSGGIDPEAMWRLLGAPTNEQIAASHLTTALNGYATQSWVTGRGYITGITSSMVTTALGYTPISSLETFYLLNDGTYVGARIFDETMRSLAGSAYIEWFGGGAFFNHLAGKFITAGGTSAQFVKGDGSLDSTTYLPKDGSQSMTGPLGIYSQPETDSWNVGATESKIRFFHTHSAGATGSPGAYWSGVSFITAYTGFQLATHGGNGDNRLCFRHLGDTNNVYSDWYRIWHEGNSNSSIFNWTCLGLYMPQSGGIYSVDANSAARKIYGADSSDGVYARSASYAMIPDNDADDAWQVRPMSGGYTDAHLTVLHGGKIGIWTTTPIANLDIYGRGNTNPVLAFTRPTSRNNNIFAAKISLEDGGSYWGDLTFNVKNTASEGESDSFYFQAMKIAGYDGKITMNNVLTIAPPLISSYQDGLVLFDSGGSGSEGLRIRWASSSYPNLGGALWAETSLGLLYFQNATGTYEVFHTGNYSSWALPKTGGLMNSGAHISVASVAEYWAGVGDSYTGGIELREYQYSATSVSDTYQYAPGITFHWNGRYSGKLSLYENELHWITNVILHSRNYSNYALPLTGGSLTNASTYLLSLVNSTSGAEEVGMQMSRGSTVSGILLSSTTYGTAIINPLASYSAIGILDSGTPYFGGATTKYTLWHEGNDGSGSGLDADLLDGKHASEFVPRLPQEYNFERAFGSSGCLLIGRFAMYDSNVTIYIDSTTNVPQHATIVLATQNINDSGGGSIDFRTFGDTLNTITPNLYLHYPSNSRYIEIYYVPSAWSKNVIHIKCCGLYDATDINTELSSLPSKSYIQPTNAAHTFYSNVIVSGNIVATGAITAGSASDARLKTNIQSLSAEAAKHIVMALNPVTFTWNSTATELYDQYKGNDLGFIAQEVEPYLPQAIGTIFEKYMRLDQTKVIAPLVKVAQDHETRIRQLERENAELKRRLNMN